MRDRGKTMGYVEMKKRKLFLLVGFICMLFCGISDCLLSFMGEGEPYTEYGIISMNIAEVPLWYYQTSFVIGIFASVGYLLASRAVCSYVNDRIPSKDKRILKTYSFGTTMMSIGIFGIHSICCLALMNIRAAVLAGVSAETITEYFTPAALYPFIIGTTWQTVADLIAGISFIIMIIKRIIPVPKKWIVIGPLSLYVICQVVKGLLVKVTGVTLIGHLLAGGESWGIAFMFLAVFTV